jgi:hypothetical protein
VQFVSDCFFNLLSRKAIGKAVNEVHGPGERGRLKGMQQLDCRLAPLVLPVLANLDNRKSQRNDNRNGFNSLKEQFSSHKLIPAYSA